MFLVFQVFGEYLHDARHEVYEVVPHIYGKRLRNSEIKPIVYQLTRVSQKFIYHIITTFTSGTVMLLAL